MRSFINHEMLEIIITIQHLLMRAGPPAKHQKIFNRNISQNLTAISLILTYVIYISMFAEGSLMSICSCLVGLVGHSVPVLLLARSATENQ